MGRGTTQLNANSSCRMWHYNAIFATPGPPGDSTNVVLCAISAKWTQTPSKLPEVERGSGNSRQRQLNVIQRLPVLWTLQLYFG